VTPFLCNNWLILVYFAVHECCCFHIGFQLFMKTVAGAELSSMYNDILKIHNNASTILQQLVNSDNPRKNVV
jgi:hypothetical protein